MLLIELYALKTLTICSCLASCMFLCVAHGLKGAHRKTESDWHIKASFLWWWLCCNILWQCMMNRNSELFNAPCKVPQYCYHGGIGRDQQLLTSPMVTAQGFSFCRHQQYFNSRYCQLPTLIPGVRFYGSKDFATSTINHSLITKINTYILIYQIYIQLHFS